MESEESLKGRFTEQQLDAMVMAYLYGYVEKPDHYHWESQERQNQAVRKLEWLFK